MYVDSIYLPRAPVIGSPETVLCTTQKRVQCVYSVMRRVCICVLSFSHSVAMGREQQENKRAIRNTRHELSQQSAVSIVSLIHSEMLYMCFWLLICPLYMQTLITSQHQLKESEAELSKLQNHLKELNREYRARLTRYIQDVTVCDIWLI